MVKNILLNSLCKYTDDSDYRQGKRRLTSKEEVKIDLDNHLVKLFNCFYNAIELYNERYANVPTHMHVRNYSALNFNQCLVLSSFQEFANKSFFAKYRRFALNIEGYIIQFKKLNKKGLPMNIKTGNVSDISNQLSLDLFGESNVSNPILFFGYKTDKLGNFVEPQLIYIDENKVKFTLVEGEINYKTITIPALVDDKQENIVRVRNPKKLKKIN